MQSLFRLLGVFVGGFTVETAEAVLHQIGSPDLPVSVPGTLATLLEHSLITRDGEPYGMLESLREFA